ALVEIAREHGPRIICNNEEERFSGERHTTKFPHGSVAALDAMMRRNGGSPERIDAWMAAWDNAAHGAVLIRSLMEEAPAALFTLRLRNLPTFELRQMSAATRAPRNLGHQLGCDKPVPFIAPPHHDNHAWFSFCASPFAGSNRPV